MRQFFGLSWRLPSQSYNKQYRPSTPPLVRWFRPYAVEPPQVAAGIVVIKKKEKETRTYLRAGVGAKKPAAKAGKSTSKVVRRPSMILWLSVWCL